METLTFRGTQLNDRNIDRAVRALADGDIIIYPTDTLYALGCDALNNRAVERLCRIKGINPDKQLLSVICSDISEASEYARIDNRAFRLLKEYLPGPYTFILPASTRLPKVFKGRKSVGVRVPDCEIARALAATLGNPVLSTSVVIDDDAEAVEPESIAMHYDDVAALIIDAGPGGVVPSTVVDLLDSSEPAIVRQGAGEFAI
ncbi:MAG: L-threonylcarbamoyladenylate synthase [Bacteroidales bacterium]|nr:L-threonylcarbamoyladenylate synthase [Bacteroidales bacterium]